MKIAKFVLLLIERCAPERTTTPDLTRRCLHLMAAAYLHQGSENDLSGHPLRSSRVFVTSAAKAEVSPATCTDDLHIASETTA